MADETKNENTADALPEPEAAAEPEAADDAPARPSRPRTRRAVKKPPAPAVLTPAERQAAREQVRAGKAKARRAGRAAARTEWQAGAHERVATPPREHESGTQKTRQGVVISDKADKTITVRIDVARRHRKYQKIVRTSTTLHAHDESNDAHVGDTVIVREARPLSRTKRWRLVQVVERVR